MSWPFPSHFSTILQHPRLAFRDPQLRACQFELNADGQPRVWAGPHAIVYKATDALGKPLALRVFTGDVPQRQAYYERILPFVKALKLQCLVDFEYHEAGIRSAHDGRWYPVVVMDWVEGRTLHAWVGSKCRAGKGPALEKAVLHWSNVIEELTRANLAHGDLCPSNVLVTPRGQLKLVDYDTMCVPSLVGCPNLELGSRPYQHPHRTATTRLTPQLDHFSALVIYAALRALAADTNLWFKYVEQPKYEGLLVREEDLLYPETSALCEDLSDSPDPIVRKLASRLCDFAAGALDDVPPLARLVGKALRRFPLLLNTATQANVERQGPAAEAAPAESRELGAEVEGESAEAAGESRPATRLHIEIMSGELAGTVFLVAEPGTVVCGRGADCHIAVGCDRRMSRQHFVLELTPPHAYLRDLGSRNATYVNGQRYSSWVAAETSDDDFAPRSGQVELRHGDRILAGRTELQVRFEEP